MGYQNVCQLMTGWIGTLKTCQNILMRLKRSSKWQRLHQRNKNLSHNLQMKTVLKVKKN